MSQEQLESFIEKVKADAKLQESLAPLLNPTEENISQIIAIAERAGFSVNSNDVRQKLCAQEISDRELSEDELNSVAGGGNKEAPPTGPF